jgi:deoxyribodipyrimidine photo-lyase
MPVHHQRIRILKDISAQTGPVVYWMSRDQRVNDNWAFLFAQELALQDKMPLGVVFCLVPQFLRATIRQYRFMLKGLQELEKTVAQKNIPFFLLPGQPEQTIPVFIRTYAVGKLVTDFGPLRINRDWKDATMNQLNVPVYEVDAHNIVPCWSASGKQEFSARTIRPKLHRLLPEFLEDFSKIRKHPHRWKVPYIQNDWPKSMKTLKVDRNISEATWIRPGERSARRCLRVFIEKKLSKYNTQRNDPSLDGQSTLSPYLHFGQLSAQRVALEIQRTPADKKSRDAFLEELIIRRELSENFCFYNENYDNVKGFPQWAWKSLQAHRKDKRDYLYTLDDFENARTHDALWNAAQMEMVKRGKMHGYMRMYWAKKILEWTKSPEQAMEIAIGLNDRYELDGRDPNGYTGIAWSIGGVHDRAWSERPVFGKIRYMSYFGAKSKFDIKKYIAKVKAL